MLNISVPVLSILLPALLLVTTLAVQEQDSEVDHEEVGEDHAPSLRLARDNVLAIAVLEEVRVRLGSGKWVLRRVADHIAGHRSGENIGPAHKPVAEVVDVAGHTPPSGDEQARASFGLDVLEVRHAGVFRVGPEAVLLVVDGAEDVVSEKLDSGDGDDALDAEVNGIDGQVAGLDGVGEWDPDEIAKGQHHAEAVLNDVHGGQDGRLHVE